MKNFFWSFFKKLANLNLSIFILFLISFFCVLGSIIEQDQNLLYYQNNYPKLSYSFLSFNWEWIITLGLDHIFRTWWFICILLIFVSSLFSCTLSTQLPSLKNARRWKFVTNELKNNNKSYLMNTDLNFSYSFINMIYSLLRSNFFVFCQSKSLYSYKGLYGRIAPIFVHLGIIFILFGSMFSFLSSFVVQEMIPNGEIFHFKNILHSGFYSTLPADIFGHIENFYIDYSSDGSVKQFFSRMSLFYENRNSISSKLISVNTPLRFHGISLYQTDWQVNAIRIQVGQNKIFQQKFIKTSINEKSCWLSSIWLDNDKQVFFVLFNLGNNVILCNSDGLILDTVNLGQEFYINNISFVIENIISSTGLQIKVDPGISVVYFGFFVLMLSTILSYLSYSQIWVHQGSELLKLFGSTNRAILFFEEDILLINDTYNYYSSTFKPYNDLFDKILR